jgi:leucyl-tRNA synthetase
LADVLSNTPQFWQDRWAAFKLFEVDPAVIQDPESQVYVAFDSAPFTNGDLHVGSRWWITLGG